MMKYMGTKKVVVSKKLLSNVHFDQLSPTGLDILRNSSSFYKSALLQADPKNYQKAAYGLAKSRFNVK